MFHRARTFLIAAALLVALPTLGHASLVQYIESFEGMVASDPGVLTANAWIVYGNVYSPDHTVYFYGYGPYGAPNGGNAFSAVASGQGGAEQGLQQLSVYNDYNNTDHALGRQIESNVYREQIIAAGDVGTIWTFQFDAKLGNLVAPSTALAFIKTLNPAAGWATTNFVSVNTTAIPTVWNTYTISLPIDASLVGQVLQIGFACTATGYISSGVFYDNLVWHQTGTTGVGDPVATVLDLRPAAPNPFSGSTRLDYSLPQQGLADISVYDIGGRRMATLFHGVAEAGPHAAFWDGRMADGSLAPAGVYHAVLQTTAGRTARNVVLAR